MKTLLLLAFCFASCSPATRLANFLKRHPDLIKSDTVYRQDTTIVKEIHSDTSFILTNRIDTFTISKDKLKVKIIHQRDTLRIASVVRADTIIKTIPVTVNTVQPPKPFSFFDKIYLFLGKAMLFFLILLIIYILLRFAFKVKMPF